MKLQTGDLIQVHGWVMLQKVAAGMYRVKKIGSVHGVEFYDFSKPKGKKTIVRHAVNNVDPWLKDQNNSDLNKIVLVGKS
jgi:hypothetical protein